MKMKKANSPLNYFICARLITISRHPTLFANIPSSLCTVAPLVSGPFGN